MFLDAIFFIPTLFTYLLIGLLIVILCFVVVYISHKIYVSVYDNLPLAALPGNSRQQLLGLRHSNHAMTIREYLDSSLRSPRSNQPSLRSVWIQNRSQILETSSGKISASETVARPTLPPGLSSSSDAYSALPGALLPGQRRVRC